MSEVSTVRLWQVKATEKAYLFSTTPNGRLQTWGRDGNQAWVPRTMVEHITRRPGPTPEDWPECMVKAPLWFLEQRGLV